MISVLPMREPYSGDPGAFFHVRKKHKHGSFPSVEPCAQFRLAELSFNASPDAEAALALSEAIQNGFNAGKTVMVSIQTIADDVIVTDAKCEI